MCLSEGQQEDISVTPSRESRGHLGYGEPSGTQTPSALTAPPARPKQKASRMGSLTGAVPPKTARGCASLGYQPYACMGRIGKSGCLGRPAQRVPIRRPRSRGEGSQVSQPRLRAPSPGQCPSKSRVAHALPTPILFPLPELRVKARQCQGQE